MNAAHLPPHRPFFKVGDPVIDPMNRRVTIIAKDGDEVTVRCAGPYGTTVRYPVSSLRWGMHDDCDNRGGACTACRTNGWMR